MKFRLNESVVGVHPRESEQLKTSVAKGVHLYILVVAVSGTSSSCLPPDFGLHLRKQAASGEVEQPETLAEDS